MTTPPFSWLAIIDSIIICFLYFENQRINRRLTELEDDKKNEWY